MTVAHRIPIVRDFLPQPVSSRCVPRCREWRCMLCGRLGQEGEVIGRGCILGGAHYMSKEFEFFTFSLHSFFRPPMTTIAATVPPSSPASEKSATPEQSTPPPADSPADAIVTPYQASHRKHHNTLFLSFFQLKIFINVEVLHHPFKIE